VFGYARGRHAQHGNTERVRIDLIVDPDEMYAIAIVALAVIVITHRAVLTYVLLRTSASIAIRPNYITSRPEYD